MNNQEEKASLPATDSAPKPGDFPIGSVKSRAAARAILTKRNEESCFCGTCMFSGLPLPAPEERDAHYDYETGEYKNLHHSPAEHARLGLSIKE